MTKIIERLKEMRPPIFAGFNEEYVTLPIEQYRSLINCLEKAVASLNEARDNDVYHDTGDLDCRCTTCRTLTEISNLLNAKEGK